jgi:hypothetical protein
MVAPTRSLYFQPSQYSSNGIMEMDINNNPTLAVRELNITTPGQYTVDTPFNFANPPPVRRPRYSGSQFVPKPNN